MFTLKTKLQQRQIDSHFGMEASDLLQQFPDQKAATIRDDLSNFYSVALNYLEKWYDFTDINYQKNVASLALKSRFTFSQLSDAVEALQIRGKLDMDELYDEYCSILLIGTITPNLTAVASSLFSTPITNAPVEREFSLMTAAWTDQRNRCSVELIKSEIFSQVLPLILEVHTNPAMVL